MKKVLLLVAAVALVSLSSCSDEKSCYELTTTATILGVTTSTTTYVYGTEDDAITQKTLIQKTGAKCTYKKTSKSESDCKNNL